MNSYLFPRSSTTYYFIGQGEHLIQVKPQHDANAKVQLFCNIQTFIAKFMGVKTAYSHGLPQHHSRRQDCYRLAALS